MKTTLISVLAAMVLVGCASQSDLEALRADVVEVHNMAEGANQTALEARQCCADNRQTIDRMYQKLMIK
jgi:hypothetical protein